LADQVNAAGIYCSRYHEPWNRQLESDLHTACLDRRIDFKRFPGSLLFEPEAIANQSGNPFRVFTPFWRHCLRQPEPRPPLPAPRSIRFAPAGNPELVLDDLDLRPTAPNWAEHWDALWQPGEEGALRNLRRFLKKPVTRYSEGRDYPALQATSRLSPHLHFGELSPRQLWHTARRHTQRLPEHSSQVNKFLSELGWREFSHHLLHHFPSLPEKPFKEQFADFPWLGGKEAERAWQRGHTGYPIVDAGMRELWHTGFMHNRVRMIVASFLTKHLLIPWQAGERWFWDTLVDADLANNACGWQWVAGSGADASPYFRIFNPTLQGEKFDKQGAYVRHWVPELALLPDKYIHCPATAPNPVLRDANVTLGTTYPFPIVDHPQAREAALAAYSALKAQS
jgi:deoxyribodipyrimidine photo-lyase